MIPERSNLAKSAKSVFFQDVNDLDVYIEDTASGYEKLYTIILSRVFHGKYRVERVFPIGDRGSVIESHKSHQRLDRSSIYIVDGDFYLLVDDTVKSVEGLFKLPVYCIENVLCDPSAILDLLDEEDPINDYTYISDKYDYDQWYSRNGDLLFRLFCEYAVSFKLNPTEATVSFPVNKIVASGEGDISEENIVDRIEGLRALSMQQAGEDAYDATKSAVLDRFSKDGLNKLDIVSGKDYLFPLLKMRAKSVVKTKIPDINFKQRVAKRCDLHCFQNIEDFVF